MSRPAPLVKRIPAIVAIQYVIAETAGECIITAATTHNIAPGGTS